MTKQQTQQQSFLTTINVPLPSKGLLYPVDSPLHKKESVDVREMTANEEDILTSLSMIRTGKSIDEVIKACLMTPNLDPDKMLVGDRNRIITGLVLASYGNKYKVDVKCENCNETNKNYEFDINNLPVKYLEVSSVQEGLNEFDFELPKSKKKVTFMLPTADIEKEISNHIKKLQNISHQETNSTTRLKYLLLSIDGNNDKKKIAEFLDRKQMPIIDSIELRKYIDSISPDIDTNQDFQCQQCGWSGKITIPVNFNFFWRN